MVSPELDKDIRDKLIYYKDKAKYFQLMDYTIISKDYSEICDLLEKVLNDKSTV